MNIMKKILLCLVFVILLSSICLSQTNYLDRVSELQNTAKLANGGKKGCGVGSFILVTSYGEIKVTSGLDPIHVFGTRIVTSEILKLLEARVKSNETGNINQMSREVENLIYVVLSVLMYSKDKSTIPVISKLLNDKNDTVRSWSVIALKALAESDENLMEIIKNIKFPVSAISSAEARGFEKTNWLIIKQ